jgi:carbon storage regulator
MLVLTRKRGEEIIVGSNIRLTVVEIRGNQVRLGLTAPADIPIRRAELPCTLAPPARRACQRRAAKRSG